MLAAAALVPDTALLVPGAAGRAEVLAAERAAALEAVEELVAASDRVVVVATGGHRRRGRPGGHDPRGDTPADEHGDEHGDVPEHDGVEEVTGLLVPTLTAAGIPDGALGVAPAPRADAGVVVHDVGAAVALLLLTAVGVVGPGHLLRTRGHDAGALAAAGRRVTDGTDRVGLLLAGSLSARRGPVAPWPEDDRAEGFDTAVLDDLVDLGPRARARLTDVPGARAEERAVTAWGPWQVLVGAAGAAPPPAGRLRVAGAPFGATYAVLSWLAEPR